MSHEVMQDLTTDTRLPAHLPAGRIARSGARGGRGRSAVPGRGGRGRPPWRGRGADGRGGRRRSRPAGRSWRRWPTTRCRTTACPPGSARWPTGTSRASCAPSCSAAWCARTRRGRVRRSSARSCARMQLLRLSTLATGRTGVRLGTARRYAALLTAGITPVVAEYGSLGCSGDLAPLAACALALTGEGTVRDAAGSRRPAADALAAAAIEPVTLREKEGLALINGTDGMLGMLVLACHDLEMLLRTADITAAMSVEALLGTDAAFAAGPAGPAPAPRPGRQRREPAGAAGRLGGGREPPPPRLHPRAGRLLAALLAAGARGRPRHRGARGDGRRARARRRGRQPGGAARRAGGEQRQLPRRAVAYVLDFLAIAVADLAGDQRAPHRPPPRRRPQPRPAGLPRRRRRASTPGT